MQKLNLPSFDYKLTEIGGKAHIFDIIRRKYVQITPEEWVRQHVLHWLINHYQYPKSLIRTESGMKYNQLMKRTDILIYDREGNPFLLVECKAPHIKCSETVLNQALQYNATLKAPYLLITNGLEHFGFEIKDDSHRPFEQMPLLSL